MQPGTPSLPPDLPCPQEAFLCALLEGRQWAAVAALITSALHLEGVLPHLAPGRD